MQKLLMSVAILSVMALAGCNSKDEALFNKALALQKEGKYEYAIENYKQVIDRHPESKFVSNANVKLNQCIDAMVSEADDLSSSQEFVKAAYIYEKVVELRPNDLDAKAKLASTRSRLSGESTHSTEAVAQNTPQAPYLKAAVADLEEYRGKELGSGPASVSRDSIRELIGGWQASWMSKDVDRYSSYYNSRFVGISSGNIYDKLKWVNYKAATFSKYDEIFIRTRIEDFSVNETELKINIRQSFTGTGASPYSDNTLKQLTFLYEDGNWTIVGERPI